MTVESWTARVAEGSARVAANIVAQWPISPAREVVTPITIDEWATITVGQWGGYWIQIRRLMFNERVLLTPKLHPTGLFPADGSHDYAWCYPPVGRAVLALMIWDPQEQAEPPGFIKRVSMGIRVAGETARGYAA